MRDHTLLNCPASEDGRSFCLVVQDSPPTVPSQPFPAADYDAIVSWGK